MRVIRRCYQKLCFLDLEIGNPIFFVKLFSLPISESNAPKLFDDDLTLIDTVRKFSDIYIKEILMTKLVLMALTLSLFGSELFAEDAAYTACKTAIENSALKALSEGFKIF